MQYINDDVIIDESNFDQYFFDVRNNIIKKDQILAKYSAIAELKNGKDKAELIKLLLEEDKLNSALQYVKNIFKATEKSGLELCINLSKDLLKYKNIKEVLNKSHKYVYENLYYTYPECVPEDPHWSLISIKNI